MRDSGIEGHEWISTRGGEIWWLVDRDGMVKAEVCRMPSELDDDRAAGGRAGGPWSWLVRPEQRYGRTPTDVEAFRQCEHWLRTAMSRVA